MEYALILAGIAALLVGVVFFLGRNVFNAMVGTSDSITSADGTGTGTGSGTGTGTGTGTGSGTGTGTGTGTPTRPPGSIEAEPGKAADAQDLGSKGCSTALSPIGTGKVTWTSSGKGLIFTPSTSLATPSVVTVSYTCGSKSGSLTYWVADD